MRKEQYFKKEMKGTKKKTLLYHANKGGTFFIFCCPRGFANGYSADISRVWYLKNNNPKLVEKPECLPKMVAFCERAEAVQGTANYPDFHWTNLVGGHLQSLSDDSIYNSLIQHQKETNFAGRDMSLLVFLKGTPTWSSCFLMQWKFAQNLPDLLDCWGNMKKGPNQVFWWCNFARNWAIFLY